MAAVGTWKRRREKPKSALQTVPWSFRLYQKSVDLLTPGIRLFLWQRALRGVDIWDRVGERLGRPSLPHRPVGPIFWFHGASIGECALAVSLVEKCKQETPYATVLFTTQDTLALSFIERAFPKKLVICQYAPLDTSASVERFLRFWRPFCIVLLESELWPNLLLSPLLSQVRVGILNARMSARSFHAWSASGTAPLAASMLSRVRLLTTPHSVQGLQFQLLGVNPMAVHYTGDLKFATQGMLDKREAEEVERLRHAIGKRPLWLAACTHPHEEEVVARIHVSLLEELPDLLTILAPRHPNRVYSIAKMVASHGLSFSLRSRRQPITRQTQVYFADTTGEMGLWYTLAGLAFVGGSLVPGVGGHNISEAAFFSCAVLVGPHTANFQQMVEDMQKAAPLSVQQVAGEEELRDAVWELLGNEAKLNARSIAAKRAGSTASQGVVAGVWDLVRRSLLVGSEPGMETEGPIRADGPDAELSPILHKQLLRAESDRHVPSSSGQPDGTKRSLTLSPAKGANKDKGLRHAQSTRM